LRAEGNGDPEAQKHVLAFARLTEIETRIIELLIDTAETRTIVPLDQVILDAVRRNELIQAMGFFLRGLVKTEDNRGQIGDGLQLFQDISEHGSIVRIRKFARQEGHNQDGFLPLGMEPQLGPQIFSILLEDVKRGDMMNILRKIRNGAPPFPKEGS